MVGYCGLIFFFEIGIKDIANSKAGPTYFIFVGRANSAKCTSDFRIAFCCFRSGIEDTVGWKDQVGFLRNEQTLFVVWAFVYDALNFFSQSHWIYHHAVANQVDGFFAKNP